MTSVVGATRQVNGRRQTYPSHHTHTPKPTVTKYCTRDYVHHISPQATFGQDRPKGYFPPYSQSYHSFFLNFFLCTQKSFYRPRAQAVEPILSCDISTDAYSRRVVPFGGQKTIISHLHLQNPQKPNFWAHIMVSLWEIYIPITA